MATSTLQDPQKLTWIFKLPIPKTQKLVFEDVMTNVDQATKDNFQKISKIREEMKLLLDQESNRACITIIEKYMPYFFGLMNATENLPPDFSKYIRVIWNTPIGLKYGNNPYVSSSFRWEVIMTMLAYGIALRNCAFDALKTAKGSSFDEQSKDVANLLCRAAGVFDHISEELFKWKEKPNVLIPELHAETYLALSTVCIAEASEITAMKGLAKGTSHGAIARLTTDIFQKYDHALSLLHKLATNSITLDQIFPPFVNYLIAKSALWKGVTYKLLAEDKLAKGEFGLAIAHGKAALESMIERKDNSLDQFSTIYHDERLDIFQFVRRLDEDNEKIYFEIVPKDPTLLALPEGKCLMKSVPFVPPTALAINITVQKGFDCSIM